MYINGFDKEGFREYLGREPGPTSLILAGVHGNEICGIKAFENILPNLQIQKGRVIFGYGNPKAISTKQRLFETNLNRMFKADNQLSEQEKQNYEYARAQVLKKYFDQADVLLDIHSSNTPRSKPFLICEKNSRDLVKYLPFNLVVSGFDEIQPGGTDSYMNTTGKIGICAECGSTKDPAAVQMAEETIKSFLAARGHISRNLEESAADHIQVNFLYFTKTDKFVMPKALEDFEKIEKSTLIGYDGEEEIVAQEDSIILFAHDTAEKNAEAFLLAQKVN